MFKLFSMRKIKFILAAFAVAVMSLSAYAQEDGNRDANGYIVKGPYLTNGGGSNVFVGLGGGANTTLGVGLQPFAEFKPANNWAAEAFVGKWFTPSIGARVGYKGVMNNVAYDTDLYTANFGSGEQLRFGYVHGDLMWNLSDALSGYKETRFWDIIPYVGAGYLGINNGKTDNKLAASAGLYNQFRLGKVVNLYLDLNVIGTENPVGLKGADGPVVNDNTFILKRPLYMPTATIGVTFNISRKKNFDRFKSVGVYKADYDKVFKENSELQNRVGALETENNTLKNELIDCQKRAPEVKEVVKEVEVLIGSSVVTFEIGKSTLDDEGRQIIKMFAENFAGHEAVIKVVGSADSKTGTVKRNNELAEQRAEVVRKALVEYGVPADNIKVEHVLDATEFVETSRSAIISLD